MNKKTNKKITNERKLEYLINNLSDLSNLDSDDDVYYHTPPVTSPADYSNLPEENIIELVSENLSFDVQ